MGKISYINQMNAFLERREVDCLPPSAVLIYLVLFKEFNKTKWKYEWLTLPTRKLTCLIGNNSASFLYSHRRILIELEYIQIRQSGSLRNRLTEYRLVPLYDVGTSNNSQNDEEIYTDGEIPQYEGVPADGTQHGTHCGTHHGTPADSQNDTVPSSVPSQGTHHGTHYGTHHGTPTASQPLCPKASQSPKNKIEEKDKNLSGSIPQYEGIQSPKTNQQEEAQPRIPKPPTEEEFHLCFDTYNVCLNREPTYDEKMKLIELVRKYTAKNVLEALNHLYEKALNESPEIVVTSHKRGKPDSLHITLEACEKLLWQRKMGLDKPMPRRTEPVKGWEDFRPA